MFAGVQDSFALLLLIALVPGVIAWWSGRRLQALVEDPILPERLTANQRRNGITFFIAFAGLATLAPPSLIWTAPLLFLAITAAGYPLRKVLFGEAWGLGAYLSFFSRLLITLYGFWVLVAAMPAVARLAGRADWVVGSLLAALLFFWNARYADVLRFSLRTRALDEGPVLDRCRALAARCATPTPRFERIDLHGGVVANALALPSLRTSSVLFTDTLLTRLEQDEVAAICAHELAHLEYYSPQRLARMNLVTHALIALGALWAPVMRAIEFESSRWPALVWFGLLLVVLAMRAKGKQKQETVCDERAVVLMGDPDPLIRALTKLYTIARIPRRIEAQVERSDTHPSLARRIRDIRKAGGAAPARLESVAAFTSPDGRTLITFEDDKLRWVGSDAVTHSVHYSSLGELRIDAGLGRAPRLVIAGAGPQRWELPLAASDVARAQSVLDIVDSRLGEHTAPPPRVLPVSIGRPGLAFLTLIALMMGHISVGLAALLACLRPSLPLLVAAGLAALTSAGVMVRDRPTDVSAILALPAAVGGVVLLLLAWSHRHDEPRNIRPHIAVLAFFAALAVMSLTLTGIDAVRLHQAVRMTPSAIILPVALASALACSRTRRRQLAGAAVVTVAMITAFAGSATFLDRFGRDPFLLESPAIEWVAVDGNMIDEFVVPPASSRVRLSPDGRHVAVLQQERYDGASTFHVGRAGERLTPLTGNDLIFVDDDHVLLAEADEYGTTLRKIKLDDAREVVWRQRVEGIRGASLTFDAASAKWQLAGWDRDRGMVRADGVVGTPQLDRAAWPAPANATREAWAEAFTTAGPNALVVENHYEPGALESLLPVRWSWILLLVQPYNQESQLWTIGPGGRTLVGSSRFGSDCHAGIASNDALVCTVFDGTRTRILSIDASGRIAARGWLRGSFANDRNIVPGWLTGWADSSPVAIKLGTRQALRLQAPNCVVSHLTVSGDRLAAVVYDQGGSKVRTYALRRGDDRSAKSFF